MTLSVIRETTPPASLSEPDVVLLSLLAEGLPIDTVGRRLRMSGRTVRRRTRSICNQIGVQTPIQAIVWAVRRGLV